MRDMNTHPLRMTYIHMMNRCYMPTDKAWQYYGGRGIKVCQEWIDSRESFYKWALPLWKKGFQLDRTDNDGPYSPDNCRFVTPKENMRNSSHFIRDHIRKEISQLHSVGVPIARLARSYQVSRPTIYSILSEQGMYQPAKS